MSSRCSLEPRDLSVQADLSGAVLVLDTPVAWDTAMDVQAAPQGALGSADGQPDGLLEDWPHPQATLLMPVQGVCKGAALLPLVRSTVEKPRPGSSPSMEPDTGLHLRSLRS